MKILQGLLLLVVFEAGAIGLLALCVRVQGTPAAKWVGTAVALCALAAWPFVRKPS